MKHFTNGGPVRLRHIEVFRAVMLTGTVSEAARLLSVSQPVVSRTLQHAELQLGLKLFDRVRGRLVPTAEAHALFGEVDRVFGELERVRRLAANLRREGAGHLRVAATPSLAQSLLPGAIGRLRARQPNASIALHTQHTERMLQALLTHDVDIGFAIEPPAHEAIVADAVCDGEMILACPARWSGDADAMLPFAALLDRPMIALDDDTALGLLVRDALARRGLAPEASVSVETYALARALVAEGLGFAFLDAFTAASGEDARIACHRLREPIGFQVRMLRARHRPSSVLSERLAQAFVETARERLEAASKRWRRGVVDLGAPARGA